MVYNSSSNYECFGSSLGGGSNGSFTFKYLSAQLCHVIGLIHVIDSSHTAFNTTQSEQRCFDGGAWALGNLVFTYLIYVCLMLYVLEIN